MEIISLTKEEFLYMLLSDNSFDSGYYGKLYLKDNKLYKINYRDFMEMLVKDNKLDIDELVDNDLKILMSFNYNYKNPEYRAKEFDRLKDTKTNDLITGVLSYRNLFVGIIMNYYKGYIPLTKAASNLTFEQINYFIDKAKELVYDLMEHGIVSRDIKEDNILVNLETNDVKLIDLDDIHTIYGPLDYVKKYPHHELSVRCGFDDMTKRVTVDKRKVKTLSDELRKLD